MWTVGSSNEAMQLTTGRRTASISLYKNTSIAIHARFRQPQLILFSLGA